jgi:hypothetical protein
MGTSEQRDPLAEVREFRAAGDTRRAVHAARHELERQAAALRHAEPARAALADAGLAGALITLAGALPDHQPRKPRGYSGGPPSAAHLLAAFETACAETARR